MKVAYAKVQTESLKAKTKTGIQNHVYFAHVKTKDKFASPFIAHQQNVRTLYIYQETVVLFAKATGIIRIKKYKQAVVRATY